MRDEMRKELDIDWEKELGDSNPIEMLNKVMEKLNKTNRQKHSKK